MPLPTSEIITVDGDLSIPPARYSPIVLGEFVRMYPTATELAADTDLLLGAVCQTTGYSAVKDGGGTTYVIEEEPYLWGSVELENGLYANLVNHETVSAIALGFKSDGTDNGPVLEALMVIKRANANIYTPLTIVFPPGDFVFSPVTCDTCGLNIEGYGTPNTRAGSFTRFLPAGNQEYILKFGRDNVIEYGPNDSQFMYRGSSIKRIRFSTLKYGQDDGISEVKDDNWWTLSKAALIIGRLTLSKFEDLFFWQVVGSAISITASYELSFYNTYIYHIVCLENGALNFAEDIGNQQQGWASDNSALYFDYVAFEGVAGDCITFDRLCDTYNTMFGVIDYEDYRTSSRFGTVWTSDTWLPNGYDAPDVELAIFHFKERCSTDQTIVSQLQWQQPSTRSFMYDGTCYAKTALMKVDGYVYDASLSVGVLDVRTFSSRGPVKTILSPSPYTGDRINLYIGKVINNSSIEIRPEGYVRTYEAHFEHTNSRNHAFDINRMANYRSVYESTAVPDYAEYFEREEIETYSPYSTKWVGISPALGKASTEAYSYNGICALPPLPSVLPSCGNVFGASPIRIVITGEILKIRVYLPAYDELICQIRSCDDYSILKTFNLQEYHDTGWQWLTFDMSEYIGIGYLTFAMRPNSTSEPLLDVYYFEQKIPVIPEIPDVYDNTNTIKELDAIHDGSHSAYVNGVSFEYFADTKTVTATGTATEGAALFYVSFDQLDPGVYYINANITQSDTHRLLLWDVTAGTQAKDSKGNHFVSLYANETNEFVVEPDHEYTIMFRVDEGKTVDGVIFSPVIYALDATTRRKGVYDDIALDIHTELSEEDEHEETVANPVSYLKEINAIDATSFTRTLNGVTFTYSNGVLTANGIASDTINLFIPLKYLPEGVYYASADVTPTGSATTYRMLVHDISAGTQAKDSTGANFKSIVSNEVNEFVIESRKTYRLMFRVDSDVVVDNVTFTPKIYSTIGTTIPKGTFKSKDLADFTGGNDIPSAIENVSVLKPIDVFSDDETQTGESNGIEFLYAEGVISFYGTSTATAYFTHPFGALEGGTYYLQANVLPLGATDTYRVLVNDETAGETAKDSTGVNFKTLIADEIGEFVAIDGHEYSLIIIVDGGITIDNATMTPVMYVKAGDSVTVKSSSGKTLSIVDWIPEMPEIPEIPDIPSRSIVLTKVDVFGEEEAATDVIQDVEFVLDPGDMLTVTANGTCDSEGQAVRWLAIDNLPVGTYLAGVNISGGSDSTYNAYIWDVTAETRAVDSAGESFKTLYGKELSEFVVEEQTSGRYVLGLRVAKGATVTDLVFRPVIFSKDGVINLIYD